MTPALEQFHRALETIEIQQGFMSSYSNVTGTNYRENDDIKDLLLKQLVEPVQWCTILEDIRKHCSLIKTSKLYEIGTGRQIKSMVGKFERRLVRKVQTLTVWERQRFQIEDSIHRSWKNYLSNVRLI